MKVLYKDHIKWALRDAKKEAISEGRVVDTVLLFSYEFDNLIHSYPNLDIHTDPATGKHSTTLEDGIIVVEV